MTFAKGGGVGERSAGDGACRRKTFYSFPWAYSKPETVCRQARRDAAEANVHGEAALPDEPLDHGLGNCSRQRHERRPQHRFLQRRTRGGALPPCTGRERRDERGEHADHRPHAHASHRPHLRASRRAYAAAPVGQRVGSFPRVSRLELRPFSDEFLETAGALLAARHRAHREAEPLLPPRYEEPAAAAAELEALARAEGASGAVALRRGRVVGYLLGAPRPNPVWGENVWVELAGQAVEQAEDLRDLYGAAAARWVEEGRVRQYAMAPAHDSRLLDAWARVGFGQQHAHGIREVPESSWPEGTRLAQESDLDTLVALTPLLADHQAASPTFADIPQRETPEELRAEILEDLAKPELGELVLERDGRVVGSFQLSPVEDSSVHAGLARPDGAVLLNWAATRPDVRGSGAGVALAEAGFAWARERGYAVIVTDWRVTNLLASRFWPARGFRETFLRLYRHIP